MRKPRQLKKNAYYHVSNKFHRLVQIMMNSPLILFRYLTIVFDVMALLMVPKKYPVLGLRSVVYAFFGLLVCIW